MTASMRGLPDTLIERTTELHALTEVFGLAAAGRAAVAVVEAPAGMGKSALLGHAAQIARRNGLTVAAAAGIEVEQDLPFAFAARLLRPIVEHASSAPGAACDDPAVAALLADGVADAPTPATTTALLRVVTEVAASRPLALLVDDAQWCDAPSLGFLRFLAARLDGEPVALVVATRPADASAAARRELDTLREASQTSLALDLEPLTKAGVHHLLRAHLGPVTGDTARDVHDLTGGNPLFVLEVIRELASDPGRDPTEALPRQLVVTAALPSVQARFLRLGPSARALGRAAAILGGGFALDDAAAAAGLDSAATDLAARELCAAAILDGDPPRFTHSLIARAVDATVRGTDRAQLHACAADVLVQRGAHPIVVARHLLEALPTASAARSDLLLEASHLALRAGQAGLALRFAERARAEPPEPSRMQAVANQLARAAAAASDARWHRLASEAIATDPASGARLLLRVGRELYRSARPADAARAYAWALDLAEDDALTLQLLARYVQATRVQVQGGHDRLDLVEQLAEAVETYPQRDSLEWRQAAGVLAYQRAITGAPARVVAELADAALDATRTSDREVLDAVTYFCGVQAASMVGAEVEVEALERVMRFDADHAAPGLRQMALAYRGTRRCREGWVDDALVDLDEAARLGELTSILVPKLVADRAIVLFEQDKIDEAAASLELPDRKELESTGYYNGVLRVRGLIRAGQGDLEGALADLLECGEREALVLTSGAIAIPWAFDAACLLVELGRRDEAAALIAAPLEAVRRQGVPARVSHGLRGLAATLPPTDREEPLREALDVLDATPWLLERMEVQLALGHTLVATGRKAEGLEVLREALDLAHRTGAARLSRLLLTTMREAGARPRRLAVSGEAALTPAEREVVRLAAQGASNPEIAQRRGVSTKAIEHHLSSAFRKLGVSSRHALRLDRLQPGDR